MTYHELSCPIITCHDLPWLPMAYHDLSLNASASRTCNISRSIIFSSNISTESCIHICTSNMNDSGVWTTPYAWAWRSHDHGQIVHAAIIHGAGADMYATYGADVAAVKWNFWKSFWTRCGKTQAENHEKVTYLSAFDKRRS